MSNDLATRLAAALGLVEARAFRSDGAPALVQRMVEREMFNGPW